MASLKKSMMGTLPQTCRGISISSVLAVGLLSGGCRTSEAVFSDVPATTTTAEGRVFQVGDLVTFYYAATNAPLSHEERIKEDGTITVGSINGRTEIINLPKVLKDPGLNRPVYPDDRIVVPRRVDF